ncbi:MAG: CpaD family pilus assembly lipoprotein [Mesorhizobium sp.]
MTTETSTSYAAPGRRLVVPLVAALGVALLSGCAMKRDSVIVGSVPDDYRTNHPIVVGETQEKVDVAVASDGYRLTRSQRDLVDGLLYRYDRSSGATVMIQTPGGSANSAAAASVSGEIAEFVRKSGIRNVQINQYSVPSADVSAPVRVSFFAIRATTNKCGRWPDDLTETTDNKHYANFGCSYQQNLAAQVANPNDLVGPRRPGAIDAERRSVTIGDYQQAASGWSPETEYDW